MISLYGCRHWLNKHNITLVLEALRTAHLYCSAKKSHLFNTELNFLGHTISQCGIEADNSKVNRILNWLTPTNAKDVHQFLRLVRYISTFLPALAEHTTILTPLTHKECNTVFPTWTPEHHNTFKAIKSLIVSHNCLTMINHQNPGNNNIYVTCDTSQRWTSTVLSFGPTWETARLVTFKSWQLCNTELHYLVHKQEMLAIIHALKKWRSDLLGSHITIYTDHQTLQNFKGQKELSKQQAWWMEYMSQYDCNIHYINGDDNCIADALSRLPVTAKAKPHIVGSIFEIRSDPSFIRDIKDGYHMDPWCKALATDLARGIINQKLDITSRNGLIFISSQLIIPNNKQLQENLFCLAHGNLGHFGTDKSYHVLHSDFYWPNMRCDLINAIMHGMSM